VHPAPSDSVIHAPSLWRHSGGTSAGACIMHTALHVMINPQPQVQSELRGTSESEESERKGMRRAAYPTKPLVSPSAATTDAATPSVASQCRPGSEAPHSGVPSDSTRLPRSTAGTNSTRAAEPQNTSRGGGGGEPPVVAPRAGNSSCGVR
jgi:hypothetical protein